MDLEKEFKLEARLYALEYMVNHAFVVLYRSFRVPEAEIEAAYSQFQETLKTETFPTSDPAMSDLAAASVEEAFARLLEIQKIMRGREA